MPVRTLLLTSVLSAVGALAAHGAENWPQFRGHDGSGVSESAHPPLRWSTSSNVRWRAEIPGEGSSSPIVWGDRVFVTSALDEGARRQLHCLALDTGRLFWTQEIRDENPELTSALTGYAASTPATDGKCVVSFFGNAGVVAYDFEGRQLWHRPLGEFESELGLASSPRLKAGKVWLVCDHDGAWYKTFDSFVISLDAATGVVRWKTDRRGLKRSWSTPILVQVDGRQELVVSAQDELRAYGADTGTELWRFRGTTGWVAPSPVHVAGIIYATSGKSGPTIAVRPGGRGDVTESHALWRHETGGSYVSSPLVYRGIVYVCTEQGVLSAYAQDSGKLIFRERLAGKFTASPVAAREHVFLTNEDGETFVLRARKTFELVAKNSLEEACLSSPALIPERILLRTQRFLWCLAETGR